MGKMYMFALLVWPLVDLPGVTDCHLCRHFLSRAGRFSFVSAYVLRPAKLATARSLTEAHGQRDAAERLIRCNPERVLPPRGRNRPMCLP